MDARPADPQPFAGPHLARISLLPAHATPPVCRIGLLHFPLARCSIAGQAARQTEKYLVLLHLSRAKI
jgi:hypothetical protein